MNIMQIDQINFIFILTINDQCSPLLSTSQLICNANQFTGFYVMGNIGHYWVNECKIELSHLILMFPSRSV